jgi:hypothetical protein
MASFIAGGRVVPAEVEPAQLHEMARDLERLDPDGVLGHREHPTRAEGGHALGARLALVRGIRGDDRLLLLEAVVLHILDAHLRDVVPYAFSTRKRITTSDMPFSGVKVTNTMPLLPSPSPTLVRVTPSL